MTKHTELLYMHDSELVSGHGEVLEVGERDGKRYLVLDRTVFYPQGGGQQFDTGSISGSNGEFSVAEVRFDRGLVYHYGELVSGGFEVGDEVQLHVNADRRSLNSRLQSAGHLIDMAMIAADYEDFKPTKGYHFPDGPYVEYAGVIDPEKREEVKQELQRFLDEFIEQGYEVQTRIVDKDEVEQLCYLVPGNLPADKPIRIVAVWDEKYLPCGGTHVKNISELEGLKITRLKSKKGNTKVSYTIS